MREARHNAVFRMPYSKCNSNQYANSLMSGSIMATTTTTHGDADGLSFPGSSHGVDDVILIIRKN